MGSTKVITLLLLLSVGRHAGAAMLDHRLSGEFSLDLVGLSRLCESARIPCGVLLDAKAPFGVGGKINADAMTARELLDAFTLKNPRYEWKDDEGTILVSPKVINGRVRQRLFTSVISRRFEKSSSFEACWMILEDVKAYPAFASASMRPVYGEINLSVKNVAAVAALNKIVREDGQMMWVVSFNNGWWSTQYSFSAPSWRRPQ